MSCRSDVVLNRSMIGLLFVIICVCGFRSEELRAKEPEVQEFVLNLQQPGETISPLLFGSNLEHTRHGVWKGIGAELLANRKFAGENTADARKNARITRAKPSPDGVVADWQGVGLPSAKFQPDTKVMYCGLQSQRIELTGTSGLAGIRQAGIPLAGAREYVVRFQLKASRNLTVTARLVDFTGSAEYGRAEKLIEPGEWREWSFRFKSPQTDPNSVLEITFKEPATLWVGSASLLPANHFHGLRRDVIDRLKEMGVPLLRWPGGNFTRDYHWKEGLQPVDRRPPVTSTWSEILPFSNNYDFHDIGIDEFIALCRELGAEPSITLHLGDGGDQEAADWVEYCNGSPSTNWGKIRAERGHPEPFRVKYWSIGNEVYGYWMSRNPFKADGYAETVNKYSATIRKVDPSITVIVAGLDAAWDKTLVRSAGNSFDWLARHEYPPDTEAFSGEKGVSEYSRQARRPQEFIRPWLAEARREMDSVGPSGKKIGISFDEWNIWHKWLTRPHDFEWHVGPADGAFLAAQFNMFCRDAASLNLKMGALFQPVNEGAIVVSPFAAELTAMGQVFSLYRPHHGGRLLPTPAPKAADPLDICATLAPDGRKVHVTVVNRDPRPCPLILKLSRGTARKLTTTILSVKELQPDIPFEFLRDREQNKVGDTAGEINLTIPRFGIVRIDLESITIDRSPSAAAK